jgi:AcrR family transcriptional regulator
VIGPQSTQGATGSRRARRKARTRQDIYEAAMGLFRERGFDPVTVDDVCRAADVARGTFFLHFPTKDAVLAEYGTRVTVELAERLAAHRGSAAEALRDALGFLAERATRHAPLVQRLVQEAMTRPRGLADAAKDGRDAVALIADLVARGQAAGELRRDIAPALAGGVVIAAYFAIVGEWTRQGGTLRLGPAVGQAVELVLRGIEARPTGRKRGR